jgi:outer membrane protein assembly factor BamD (BamD/ComL family)
VKLAIAPGIAIVLACAATATAQPSSKQRADATAAYQEGQRRYLDEDYVGAAAQFEAAYKLDPDPAYEFNIAQAYRLANDCTKSLVWYRKFLADAPKAPNIDAVKKYIADEEAACAKTAPAPAPAPALAPSGSGQLRSTAAPSSASTIRSLARPSP